MLQRRIPGAAAWGLGLATFIATVTPLRAQTVTDTAAGEPARPPWRDVLRGWCTQSTVTECTRVAGLDPDPDPERRSEEALVAADRAVREITPIALVAAGETTWAQTLRGAPAMRDAPGVNAMLGQLLSAYVALLPARARPLARGWLPGSFWQDAQAAMPTPAWRRRVRDANRPAAAQRDLIARAATLAQRASQDLAVDASMDAAVEIGALAIARGASRDDVIRALVGAVEAMPRRPPPPDPMNDGPPEHPSRRQVMVALESVRPQVVRCVGTQDGTVMARVTFHGSDGRATDVSVSGVFANTMVGSCTRTAVMSASVPAFEQDSVSVNYPFVVFGAHPNQQPPLPVIPPERQPDAPRAQDPAPVAMATATANQPVTTGDTRVAGELPAQPAADDVERVFTTLEAQVRACAPTQRGPITLTVTVAASGLPDSVAAEARSLASSARDCIEAAVMNAQFPRFSGAAVTVHHRVEFSRRGR